MPTWDEHCAFLESKPYEAWYGIAWGRVPVGCIYLSKQREIGIGVLKAFRGQGIARAAIRELMARHPGRFLANINPANEPSIRLFRSLGFGGPIQITLERAA
jgi:RimJ/RimL family protein N-acetyltransferase